MRAEHQAQRAIKAEACLAELKAQNLMNLRDWIEASGALRDGARIAWGSVTWAVEMTNNAYVGDRIRNDDTRDIIDLGTCASLPAAGWRIIKEDQK